jgi:hypothetical protein
MVLCQDFPVKAVLGDLQQIVLYAPTHQDDSEIQELALQPTRDIATETIGSRIEQHHFGSKRASYIHCGDPSCAGDFVSQAA